MKIIKISKGLKKERGVWRIVHKAMPLPKVDNYPEDFDYDSLKRNLDRDIKEETNDPEGELDFFDRGTYGVVYSPQSDPKKVVKYTFDRSEIQAAKKVWDYQKKWGTLPQHIVGLYDFGPVPSSKNVYRLVLEKVNRLKEEEQDIVAGLYPIALEYLLSDDPDTDEYIVEELDIVINESKDKEKTKSFIKEYFNMGEWLIDEGFTMDEAHGRNVGRRDNGNLVMLDYGMLSK